MSRKRKYNKKIGVCEAKLKKITKARSNYKKGKASKICKISDGIPLKKSDKQSKVNVLKSTHPCRRYEQFHDHFLDYDQIVLFLDKIQKNYPGSVDIIPIGYSGQGKPIHMVLITTDPTNDSPRHATFIQAGLKGDDTFAVSNALYIIDYLCKHPNYIKIMDYFIVPCSNPDAYDKFLKVNLENTNSLKKAGSNSSVGCKKQCMQSPQNRKGVPNNTTIFNNHSITNFMTSSDNSDDSNCSWGNIKLTNLNTGNTNKKNMRHLCKPKNKENENVNDKNQSKEKANKQHVNEETGPVHMDLSCNFPVILGLNDMRRIPTEEFIEKIKLWKENYVNTAPEILCLIKAINSSQFAVKLLISLQEGGESICFPYGFSAATTEETNDLREIAKKGKNAITSRNFQFGNTFDIQGLTYGSLIDFLKVDRTSIKYTYIIQVHKKNANYNQKEELKHLMTYGCEIMECVKRMATAVFKSYTKMTGNKEVVTACTKGGQNKNVY